ncbi:MAG: hypothetical protein HZA32_18450 [Opitutae bacterium]|nr:hypothetical protein [Opitutae bacterium]
MFSCVASSHSATRHAPANLTHSFSVQGIEVSYEVPSTFALGYSGQASTVTIQPDDPRVLHHPRGLLARNVATYYHDMKGDFRDWSFTVTVSVCKLPPDFPPPKDHIPDAAALTTVDERQWKLKDGTVRKVSPQSRALLIGQLDLVAIDSTTSLKSEELKLADGGLALTFPTCRYYGALNADHLICFSMGYSGKARITPAEMQRALVATEAIIATLKIDRPGDAPR